MRSSLFIFRPSSLCLVLLCSCASSRVSQPLTTTLAKEAPASAVDFWHALTDRPLACNDEAFHALLLWHDGNDPSGDYAQRTSALKGRGWVGRDFNEPADHAVRRGTLAMALARALKLEGGVTMRLFGPSPRYALRELEHRGLMPPGSARQAVTGADLVGIIARAQEHRETNKLEDAPIDAIADRGETMVRPILAFAEAPATLRASDGPLRATVVKVEGQAQYRPDEKSEWKPLVHDPRSPLRLGESAAVRTGAAARVTLRIEPDQSVVVGHLTTMTILRAVSRNNQAKLDIGMQYGRALIDISAHQIDHQTSIHTPNAVLAVRGTRVLLTDQRPFVPTAVSLTGRAEFAGAGKPAIAFGSRGGGKAKVTAGSTGAAEVAMMSASVDPTLAAARTDAESRFIQTVLAQGAVFSLDPGGLPIVRGGVPPTGTKLQSILPGPLSIVVTWDKNTNLDLDVSTPSFPDGRSEFIYPVSGFDRSRSGGRTAFDHRGGSSGGIEVVYWPNRAYPTGNYALAVSNVSGPTANATIQVFQDKAAIPLNEDGDLIVTKPVTRDNNAIQFFDVSTPMASPRPRSTRSR